MLDRYPKRAKAVEASDQRFHNIDEHAAALFGFQSIYQQISAGPYEGRTSRIVLNRGFRIQFETFDQKLDQWGGITRDNFVIIFLMNSSASCFLKQQSFETDDMILAPPGGDFDLRALPFTEYCSLNFPIDYIEPYLHAYNPRLREITLSGVPTVLLRLPEVVEILRSIVRQIQLMVAGAGLDHPDDGLLSGLQTSLTVIAAGVLSDKLAEANKLVTAPDRSAQLAFAARDLMRDAASAELSVQDLAEQFGVSRRTLEYAFRAVFGQTPSEYKRIILLNKFRSALVDRTEGPRLIGDVAADFGIWHLSRLAQQYKRQFHELPSESLEAGE